MDSVLECQTWVLRVFIHCEGCERKVKKVLKGIDGVYTVSIDAEQNRVTVTGNIDVQTLMDKLNENARKQAELWPETLTKKERSKPVKAKNNEKPKSSGTCRSQQAEQRTTCGKVGLQWQVPEKGHIPPEKILDDHDSQHYGDHIPVDLSHFIVNIYPKDHSDLVFNGTDITAAATAQPNMNFAPCYCYGRSSLRATFLNCMHVFSDENANGCCIM